MRRIAKSQETTGVTVTTDDTVFVVASYPHSDDTQRFDFTEEYENHIARGSQPESPKFYRSVVTTIATLTEITEDEFFLEKPVIDPNIPPF